VYVLYVNTCVCVCVSGVYPGMRCVRGWMDVRVVINGDVYLRVSDVSVSDVGKHGTYNTYTYT